MASTVAKPAIKPNTVKDDLISRELKKRLKLKRNRKILNQNERSQRTK